MGVRNLTQANGVGVVLGIEHKHKVFIIRASYKLSPGVERRGESGRFYRAYALRNGYIAQQSKGKRGISDFL